MARRTKKEPEKNRNEDSPWEAVRIFPCEIEIRFVESGNSEKPLGYIYTVQPLDGSPIGSRPAPTVEHRVSVGPGDKITVKPHYNIRLLKGRAWTTAEIMQLFEMRGGERIDPEGAEGE